MLESMDERGFTVGPRGGKNCYLTLACEQNNEAAWKFTCVRSSLSMHLSAIKQFHQPHGSNARWMKRLLTIYEESSAVRYIYTLKKKKK